MPSHTIRPNQTAAEFGGVASCDWAFIGFPPCGCVFSRRSACRRARSDRIQRIHDQRVYVQYGVLAEDAVDVAVPGNDVPRIQVLAVCAAQQLVSGLRALRQEALVVSTVDEGDGQLEPLQARKIDVVALEIDEPALVGERRQ